MEHYPYSKTSKIQASEMSSEKHSSQAFELFGYKISTVMDFEARSDCVAGRSSDLTSLDFIMWCYKNNSVFLLNE